MIEGYVDITKKPRFKIWCTARGVGGEIYGCRPYGTTGQTEYLYYDNYDKDFKWVNNNGYCKIEKIK